MNKPSESWKKGLKVSDFFCQTENWLLKKDIKNNNNNNHFLLLFLREIYPFSAFHLNLISFY